MENVKLSYETLEFLKDLQRRMHSSHDLSERVPGILRAIEVSVNDHKKLYERAIANTLAGVYNKIYQSSEDIFMEKVLDEASLKLTEVHCLLSEVMKTAIGLTGSSRDMIKEISCYVDEVTDQVLWVVSRKFRTEINILDRRDDNVMVGYVSRSFMMGPADLDQRYKEMASKHMVLQVEFLPEEYNGTVFKFFPPGKEPFFIQSTHL